ncbi:dipeptide ABC transporter ATP-binding protein [Rhodococcus sp. NPDC060176]|uniref:dipeptide ABC transporter ATP-binding protein n=1 Tax=Rhodococcus sp. NPDC060176 TaxID=3347062 RepID=UPI00366A4439
MNDIVSVTNLQVTFPARHDNPEVTAVAGIDFHIAAGECLALVGESGSGKSVTGRSLLGLVGSDARVSADKFTIDGDDVSRYGDKQFKALRGRKIGLVLQDALVSLDPLRTVGREVIEPMSIHRTHPRHERVDAAVELLSGVGIPDAASRMSSSPHELSGGLRQRALIASALAARPKVLIADEPTTALDVTVQARILTLLDRLRQEGTALLLISHDLAVVAALADRIAVMQHGRIVEQGPSRQILTAPAHPYTRTLLAASPSSHTRGRRLTGSGAFTREDLSAEPVLSVSGVSKIFHGRRGETRTAVDDVSLTLRRGEVVGIVGESGSGKTTVSRIALGLLVPDSGKVSLDGTLWNSSSGAVREKDRRPHRRRIQPISQDPLGSFDPRFDVARLISRALTESGVDGDHRGRTVELLEQVGLETAHLSRYPRQLSGGQRQRVAIARALATDPEILICDEPVSALDVSIQAQVLDLLLELRSTRKLALLFISHDLGVISHISDHVHVMKDGRIVESGSADDIFARPTHPYTRELLDSIPSLEAVAR